jgi:hypothetical protein
MAQDETGDWRPTSFRRPDGTVETAQDDWTLFDLAGRPVARVYRFAFGPNAGRWAWFVLITVNGTPFNGGTGTAGTCWEAREECEARVPTRNQARN